MSDLGIQGVLAQIRAIRAQAELPAAAAAQPAAAKHGFTDVLTRAVDKVSDTQQQAAKLAAKFERGDRDANLVQVMLAMQKSQVAFKAVTEVRNRLVQAYQDIQNMPI